eukprot:173093-Prymnesium_polylepis.1
MCIRDSVSTSGLEPGHAPRSYKPGRVMFARGQMAYCAVYLSSPRGPTQTCSSCVIRKPCRVPISLRMIVGNDTDPIRIFAQAYCRIIGEKQWWRPSKWLRVLKELPLREYAQIPCTLVGSVAYIGCAPAQF